jgi:hypothetical protein
MDPRRGDELGNPHLLDRKHRELIAEAANMLSIEWLDDFCQARRSADDHISQDASMREALPPKHWGRYTSFFAARLIQSLHVVTHVLGDPEAREPYFSNTAEELAFAALIARAEMLDEDADFGMFHELMTEDVDIELLWDMSLDGVEGASPPDIRRPVNLEFNRWFLPFRPEGTWTNPFNED